MMPEGPEVRGYVNHVLQPAAVNCRLVEFQFLSGRYAGRSSRKPTGWHDFRATMTRYSSSSASPKQPLPPNHAAAVHATTTHDDVVDVIQDWNCKGKFMYLLLDDGKQPPKTLQHNQQRQEQTTNNDAQEPNDQSSVLWNSTQPTMDAATTLVEGKDDDWQRSIWITLGMTGRFAAETIHEAQEELPLQAPRSQEARWYMELLVLNDQMTNHHATALRRENKEVEGSSPMPPEEQQQHRRRRRIHYYDARNFGTVRFSTSRRELQAKLQSLGPDILQTELVPNGSINSSNSIVSLLSETQREKLNVCKFLMDQRYLSGVGNYILAEALYRASIDPYASLAELNATQQVQLLTQVQAVAQESYQSQELQNFLEPGAGSVETDPTSASAETQQHQQPPRPTTFEFQCYGRETCAKGNPVFRHTHGPHGRTIWFTAPQLFRPFQERPHYRLFHQGGGDRNNGDNNDDEDSIDEDMESTGSFSSQPPIMMGTRRSEEEMRRQQQTIRVQQPPPMTVGKKRPYSLEKEEEMELQQQVPRPQPGGTRKKRTQIMQNKEEIMASRRRVTSLLPDEPKAARDDIDSNGKARIVNPEKAVKDLCKGLKDEHWRLALSYHIELESFQNLAAFLEQERQNGATIFPPTKEIFQALNSCPLDQVKVVLLGQDPYHGPGQAHGLAFSVRRGVRPLPPSLRNIFKELQDEGLMFPDDDAASRQQQHGDLQKWADQGVLLLNTVLTVQEAQANSHKGQGWEEFTDAVIQAVLTTASKQNRRLVFLLWGNPAAEKTKDVLMDPQQQHVIIRSSHPSPLSASRTKTPFFGSNCFRRANQALEEMGEDPIDWNVH
ncbi:hypothetical protein ACA910_020168 [Epithemia clementina (nom. ined.)]